MPNGGFGCAYCVNLERGKCALRDAVISQDHWTVCADVQYRANSFGLPTRSMPEGSVRKVSIFSITSSEGAYKQVPWYGNQEIRESQPGLQTCSLCDRQLEKSHSIFAQDRWFHFCTFKHYLIWRNEQISQNLLDDEEYPPEKIDKFFKDFTDLEVIAAVSSEESREKANQIESRRSIGKRTLIAVLVLGVFVAFSSWFGWL